MGVAVYGEPSLLGQVGDVLNLRRGGAPSLNLDYFSHHRDGVEMTWEAGTRVLGTRGSGRREEVCGARRPPGAEVSSRDRDLAASVQARLEEVLLEMFRRLYADHGNPRLVMAGGVALNCVANGRIRQETPFEEVWVQPAATDDGPAVGAAPWVGPQALGGPRGRGIRGPCPGP